MKQLQGGGGFRAIWYTWRKAREVGIFRLWRAMRTNNACKTCALGMGGQLGGMRNEAGHFPEFCKKSLQAMAADMQGRIEERFFAEYSIDQMKGFSPRELETVGRLTTPVYAAAEDSHYRPISWEEALSRISEKLKATAPEQAFFYSSGRSSNEAGFLLQLFARVYGTNHVNNCSYYCHQASGAGLSDALGTATATVTLEDVENCDLFFLIGGNPASNHPRLMSTLMRLRRRGGHVIVINPVKEPGLVNFRVPSDPRSLLFGTSVASMYVQPTIGGDIALISGICKALLEKGHIERAFLDAATEGFLAVAGHVRDLSWKAIEAASGVTHAEIERVAAYYAKSQKTIFGWTMGITHHEHGVANVQWIVNLALLRGMVGKPQAGLLPIRGHSNVQGLGSIGVTPQLKKAIFERLESMGLRPPTFAGYDTMACMEAAQRGEMRLGLALGGNLFGSNPDANFAREALSKLDMLVYLNTSLNTGHAHGVGKETIILPVLARDEEPQATTQESMFSYVRLSDGGAARHEGPRSEVSVFAELGSRVLGSGGGIDWAAVQDHEAIRKLIATLVPGFGQIAEIGKRKEEFTIPGRIFHTPRFHTPSGKAQFRVHPIPEDGELGPMQLRVMTVRSEGQFNTVVFEEEDIYRGQDRRDIILMNEGDIERMGLRVDQRVDVSSEVGVMRNVLVRAFDVARGCAVMYYPEANVLVSRAVDPVSKTPAFKSVVVTLTVVGEETSPSSLVPLTVKASHEGRASTMKAC